MPTYRVVIINPSGHAILWSHHYKRARADAVARRLQKRWPIHIVHVEQRGSLFQWSGLPWTGA